MKPITRACSRLCGAAMLSALVIGAAVSTTGAAMAQSGPLSSAAAARQLLSSQVLQMSGGTPAGMRMAPPAIPSSVLLFPAFITNDSGDAAAATPTQKDATAIITDAVRDVLSRADIGVVTYNSRLPSIQRAIAEGMKPEDAMAGPGDDPRKAQHFASILAANEYLTVTVDNYKYDQGTRTVTFNLSITRYGSDGAGLGATAQKAIGSAPADVSGPRQESFAVEEASKVVAEQAVEGIYPAVAAVLNPPKDGKKHHKNSGRFLIPVIALGAALIAPHT